jgi:hypothetical protein
MQREKMTTTEAILCGIEGVCTLEKLANELDMRKPMLMARIEFMARAGYLCEVSLGKCKGCGGGVQWIKHAVRLHRRV